MEKKGMLGLDTAKNFVVAILVVAVVGFALIITVSTLNDSADDTLPEYSVTTVNETISSVDETGETLAAGSLTGLRDIACSISVITNATGGESINTANYTTSDNSVATACVVSAAAGANYNATNWNVTYSYTYITAYASNALQNVSSGTSDFFDNASSWFALIAVAIIILIITIVILGVNRFGGGIGKSQVSVDEGL